jgi:hypothetical protein
MALRTDRRVVPAFRAWSTGGFTPAFPARTFLVSLAPVPGAILAQSFRPALFRYLPEFVGIPRAVARPVSVPLLPDGGQEPQTQNHGDR